jgi:hypothetical protein
MKISNKMLKEYVDYMVAPGFYKNLNAKGLHHYKVKLGKDMVRGRRIK